MLEEQLAQKLVDLSPMFFKSRQEQAIKAKIVRYVTADLDDLFPELYEEYGLLPTAPDWWETSERGYEIVGGDRVEFAIRWLFTFKAKWFEELQSKFKQSLDKIDILLAEYYAEKYTEYLMERRIRGQKMT